MKRAPVRALNFLVTCRRPPQDRWHLASRSESRSCCSPTRLSNEMAECPLLAVSSVDERRTPSNLPDGEVCDEGASTDLVHAKHRGQRFESAGRAVNV